MFSHAGKCHPYVQPCTQTSRIFGAMTLNMVLNAAAEAPWLGGSIPYAFARFEGPRASQRPFWQCTFGGSVSRAFCVRVIVWTCVTMWHQQAGLGAPAVPKLRLGVALACNRSLYLTCAQRCRALRLGWGCMGKLPCASNLLCWPLNSPALWQGLLEPVEWCLRGGGCTGVRLSDVAVMAGAPFGVWAGNDCTRQLPVAAPPHLPVRYVSGHANERTCPRKSVCDGTTEWPLVCRFVQSKVQELHARLFLMMWHVRPCLGGKGSLWARPGVQAWVGGRIMRSSVAGM